MKNLPKVADRQFYQHYGQAHSGQLQTRAAVLIRGGETTGQDGTKKKNGKYPNNNQIDRMEFFDVCLFMQQYIIERRIAK